MPDLNLSNQEMAAGAAVAMQSIREDRKEEAKLLKQQRATPWWVVAFVVLSSVGMLALMIYMSP